MVGYGSAYRQTRNCALLAHELAVRRIAAFLTARARASVRFVHRRAGQRFVARYALISAGVITVPNGEFKELLAWLGSRRDSSGEVPLIQFNHLGLFKIVQKEYGRHKFSSTEEWVAALDPHVKLIELLNGRAMAKGSGLRVPEVQEKDYLDYLSLGFHLAPSSGQDNHYATWGTVTDARVAVLADNLTKEDMLRALKNRRAYATEDKNLRIIFKVNDQLMGSIVNATPAAGAELDVRVSIRDDDEPDAHYRVEVFSGKPGGGPAKIVKTVEIEGDTAAPVKISGVRFSEPGQYVFLKITQTSEHGEPDRAWTAPVWFEAGAVPGGPVSAGVRIVELVPNPAGRDDDNESVTLRNASNTSVSLAGWSLRDLSGATWDLSLAGTINGGDQKRIMRNRQPMSLNNDGDTIELLNAAGEVVQTVSFGPAAQDEVVRP